ncbi:hypothetical protein [Roseibium aggregatum]|uniref:Membrane-bound lysozyme inhibitor of c-type lysozyme MliC n=1 Tax=Roseibium aggregatum TaxID=187304 RepID=A0A939J7M1_9HYPH|nr:hypothetical protein [Roseibium aggregatum]MBN9673979.1 hypothetical protein [Roseibium aggregatum]
MKRIAIALAFAVAPFAAQADSVHLQKPLSGATLVGTQADMSVHYSLTEDNAFEVTAVYVGKDAPEQPHKLVMALQEGDAVSFSLPGYRGEIFTFERDGNRLEVSNGAATWKTGDKSSS